MQELKIFSPETTINLLDSTKYVYIEWKPTLQQLKEPVYDNPQGMHGKNLTFYRYDTAIDTIKIGVVGETQDILISNLREIITAFENAKRYWATKETLYPFSIKVKAKDETNPRYTVITDARIEGVEDVFNYNFETGIRTPTGNVKGMLDVTLFIEHSFWTDEPYYAPKYIDLLASNELTSFDTDPTYAETAMFTFDDDINAFEKINGTWYAYGVDGLFVGYSINEWTNVFNTSDVYDMSVSPNGRVFIICGDGKVYYSDNLTIWTGVQLVTGGNSLTSVCVQNDNMAIVSYSNIVTSAPSILMSIDSGVSWSELVVSIGFTWSEGSIGQLIKLASGTVLATAVMDGNGVIIKSTDNGITWRPVYYLKSGGISSSNKFYEDIFHHIYITGESLIFSKNDGESWISLVDVTGGFWSIAYGDTSKNILGGAVSYPNYYLLYSSDYGNSFDVIKTGTASLMPIVYDNELYYLSSARYLYKLTPSYGAVYSRLFANYKGTSAITHVITLNSPSTYTNYTMPYNDGFILLSANNDIDTHYVGADTVFCNVIYNLKPRKTHTSPVLSFQYYNGSSWEDLEIIADIYGHDKTGEVFASAGEAGLYFYIPDDWATVAVNGVTKYWVRVQYVSGSFGTAGDVTQVGSVKTLTSNRVLLSTLGGDVNPLLKMEITNRNEEGTTDSISQATNRYIMGARTIKRGSISSIVNLTDIQNDSGITVEIHPTALALSGVAVSLAESVTYASLGQAAMVELDTTTYPGLLDLGIPVLKTTFDSTIALNYGGKFRVFGRWRGTPDMQLAMRFYSDIEDVSYMSDYVASFLLEPVEHWKWQVANFGEIVIDSNNKSIAQFYFDIYLKTSGQNTEQAAILDLILIPSDELFFEMYSKAGSLAGDYVLDVDSITEPKLKLRHLIRDLNNNKIISHVWLRNTHLLTLNRDSVVALYFLMDYGNPNGSYAASYEGSSAQAFGVMDLWYQRQYLSHVGDVASEITYPYSYTVLGISPASLIGYWPMNDVSGSTMDNLEGTASLDLIITDVDLANDATGPFGTVAPYYDGNTGGHSYNRFPSALSGSEFSFSMWYRSNATNADATLFNATDGMFSYLYLAFSADGLDFVLKYNASGIITTITAEDVPKVGWNHVAFTMDSINDEQKLYINGILVGTDTTDIVAFPAFMEEVYLPGLSGTGYRGWVAHAAFWSTVLTPTHIAELAMV